MVDVRVSIEMCIFRHDLKWNARKLQELCALLSFCTFTGFFSLLRLLFCHPFIFCGFLSVSSWVVKHFFSCDLLSLWDGMNIIEHPKQPNYCNVMNGSGNEFEKLSSHLSTINAICLYGHMYNQQRITS